MWTPKPSASCHVARSSVPFQVWTSPFISANLFPPLGHPETPLASLFPGCPVDSMGKGREPWNPGVRRLSSKLSSSTHGLCATFLGPAASVSSASSPVQRQGWTASSSKPFPGPTGLSDLNVRGYHFRSSSDLHSCGGSEHVGP